MKFRVAMNCFWIALNSYWVFNPAIEWVRFVNFALVVVLAAATGAELATVRR